MTPVRSLSLSANGLVLAVAERQTSTVWVFRRTDSSQSFPTSASAVSETISIAATNDGDISRVDLSYDGERMFVVMGAPTNVGTAQSRLYKFDGSTWNIEMTVPGVLGVQTAFERSGAALILATEQGTRTVNVYRRTGTTWSTDATKSFQSDVMPAMSTTFHSVHGWSFISSDGLTWMTSGPLATDSTNVVALYEINTATNKWTQAQDPLPTTPTNVWVQMTPQTDMFITVETPNGPRMYYYYRPQP